MRGDDALLRDQGKEGSHQERQHHARKDDAADAKDFTYLYLLTRKTAMPATRISPGITPASSAPRKLACCVVTPRVALESDLDSIFTASSRSKRSLNRFSRYSMLLTEEFCSAVEENASVDALTRRFDWDWVTPEVPYTRTLANTMAGIGPQISAWEAVN